MHKLLFWGQRFADYCDMFDLPQHDMDSNIYELGISEGRNLGVIDYHLPFSDFKFDVALVSHYLFADLDAHTVAFHVAAIVELARVAKEVRIVPLMDKEGNTSEFLGPVLLELQHKNYGVEVREVNCHLHKTGNAMLRVWAQMCSLDQD